jgi:ATP-dependent helicase/nuclease subunit A
MDAPTKTDSLTEQQRNAVRARGNVLVMAGAGTGKTKTLVERCLDCLERDGAAINELLIVTFTEAAAAEMRQRLRRELEKRAAANPADERWPRQLALFDLAHIGTLHSFCLQLVREHFYELGLDPQMAILDEGETRQRANATLDEQFDAHYEGKKDFSAAVQELIQVHGGGRDESIRQLILRLHNYSQTRPDADGWLAAQIQNFSAAEPPDWQRWLLETIAEWRNEWTEVLTGIRAENIKAAELAALLARSPKQVSRETVGNILAQIVAADLTANYPKGQAGKLRPALGKIFEEAEFLLSLAVIKDGKDPLVEDWTWVHGQMRTLLQLAQEFGGQFAESKRADGVMDFHDLEQFALKLLWDFAAQQPTAVARSWREKLKFIFVDEYQDINAAQDKIIGALSQDSLGVPPSGGSPKPPEGGTPNRGNRFLVGDVKQSIYRFRLADPKIFRDYAQQWRGENGSTIPLSDNFRSREALLNFVNSICGFVMHEEVGGVGYGADAELKFGSRETRSELSAAKDAGPRVELWLRLKSGRNETPDEEEGDLADLDEAQKEARLLAQRLQQLVAEKAVIFDDHAKIFRPVEWRDMAILLRSPRGKSEVFAKEFERAGIPLAVARGRFFDSAEILDLLSLLQLLDNPLQDVPCIAVLRSPLVGLSLDELAEIRLAAREKHFWTALNSIPNPKSKIYSFLQRFARWRTMARQVSLSQCLEAILAETVYLEWLRGQPRGAQRAANVTGFLQLAQQFDLFQRQGLFRFLKFIEAQQAAEVEPEVALTASENAVRLMSIHQSKGLEFPVVVVADLAKTFNEQDLRSEIIFDEVLGLCPKVKPPGSGRRYPSLPHWLAQRRQKRELRGEELRLLYVALTRARDNLILSTSVTEKNWEEKWTQPPAATVQNVTVQKIAEARSFADWLRLWFAAQNPKSGVRGTDEGELDYLRWQLITDGDLVEKIEIAAPSVEAEPAALDVAAVVELCRRLEQSYAFSAATVRKAKSSVTTLRREAEELDDEAEQFFPRESVARLSARPKARPDDSKLSAQEIGLAHHKFLQHFALNAVGNLKAEAERLIQENYLSKAEVAALDLDALAGFWNSPLGKKIVANLAAVRRELPFTARFSPTDISQIIGGQTVPVEMRDEFVVVQGVADLVVLLPTEIWLVDFKTDAARAGELADKLKTYTPQLGLYAAALEKTFSRPVTLRALHFLPARVTKEI